jgi:leucyl aminopeptidase
VEFSIKSGSPEKQRSACVVVGIFEPRKLTLAAELLDNAARNHLSDIIRRGDMEGKTGSTLLLHNVPGTLCDRVLLVGLGKEKEFGDKEYCDAIRSAVRTLNETGSFDGTVFLTETAVRKRSTAWRVRQATMVAQETIYRFDQFKSKKDKVRRPLRKLTFVVDRRNELATAELALSQGQAIAEGVCLAKISPTCRLMCALPLIWPKRHRRWLPSTSWSARFLSRMRWRRWACTRCSRSPKARINRPS